MAGSDVSGNALEARRAERPMSQPLGDNQPLETAAWEDIDVLAQVSAEAAKWNQAVSQDPCVQAACPRCCMDEETTP